MKEKRNKEKRVQNIVKTAGIILTITLCIGNIAFAQSVGDNSVTNAMWKAVDLFVLIIRAVGAVLTVKSIVEISTAWQQNDSTGVVTAAKGLAGGLIMIFAKEILGLIGVKW